MNNYQIKTFDLKAFDVDTVTKSVKIAIAELESIDRDGDVFTKTAFNKTIQERGPQGSNEIWHLIDHDASLRSGLGKFSEIFIDGKYVAGVSKYKDSSLWRDTVWPLYDAGDITQHSVGFKTIQEAKQSDGHNEIREVSLWEGSSVLWGANPFTPTLGISKDTNGKEHEPEDLYKRFNRIIKAIKHSKYNEETESLLIIELNQMQQLIHDMNIKEKTTEPVVTTLPVVDYSEVNAYLKTINKNLEKWKN